MKKAMLLIVAIITSFICINDVPAMAMYMECDYTSECEAIESTGAGINPSAHLRKRACYIDYHIFAKVTNNKGNTRTLLFCEEDGEVNDYTGILNDCWLNKITDDTCGTEGVNLIETSDISKERILGTKTCPSGVLNQREPGTSKLIPAGKNGKVSKVEEITKPVFAIYSFEDDGEKKVVGEGYNTEGKYSIVGPNLKRNGDDEIEYYQYQKIISRKGDYWKVNLYNNKLITSDDKDRKLDNYNVCKGLSKSDCVDKYKYKIIYDSDDTDGNIKNTLSKWYEEEKESIKGLKALTTVSKNSNLLTTSKELNSTKDKGENYTLTMYNPSELIKELNSAYNNLKSAYEEFDTIDYCTNTKTSVSSSAMSYLYKKMDICEIKDIAEKDDNEHNVNGTFLVSSLMEKTSEVLNDISNGETEELLDASKKATEYVESFYKTILYLERDAEEFGLTSSELETLIQLKEKYKNLIKEQDLNIAPVVSCKDLFGEDLVNKINSYLNIIKIAVPILLLIFGILDFLKAIFSDEDEMKKAQKKFMKRLGVALLIFLVPYLVNLLLKVANEVWPIISTDTCGIFE